MSASPADPVYATYASKTDADAKLPFLLSLAWGLGTVPMSAMLQATALLLLRYFVDYIGVAAALAGLLIGGAKIYDAVIDPLIGVASDRTRSRWGRRRPYILLGTFVSAGSLYLLFSLPTHAPQAILVSVAVFALLANATGYALFVIPYLAMPAEMTTSPAARTYLMSFRIAGAGVGQILGSVVAPFLVSVGGGGLVGHQTMAASLAGLIVALGLVCFIFTKDATATSPSITEHYSLGRQFKLAWGNTPFLVLIALKIVNLFAFALLTTITPFIFIYILRENYAQLGLFFLVRNVTMMLAQPLWLDVSKRWGKKATYHIANTVYVVLIAVWLLAAPTTPFWAVMVVGAIMGVPSGGVLLIGEALLPDTIENDYRRTGLRREGIFAGVYTTVEKMAFALSAAVVGVALGAAGYVQASHAHQQPASAILAIQLCVGLTVVCQIVSSFILTLYRIDDLHPTASAAPMARSPGLKAGL